MTYLLEIQLEAIVDIKTAYQWYEDKRSGLGVEFISEVEDCYQSIISYPDRYGYVQGSQDFRRIKLYRFPYIILFEISDHIVTVVRVAHIKQDRSNM